MLPSWSKAQPCRYIAHNGEINTLRGCETAVAALAGSIGGGELGARVRDALPILDPDGSDSMKFDNTLEFLINSGKDIVRSLMMMVPGAWSKEKNMPGQLKAFYEYSACLMPPWDGSAAIAFTDGRLVGALLDRNGLRPARWILTRDGRFVLASESGVLDISPEHIVQPSKGMHFYARRLPSMIIKVWGLSPMR